MRGAGCWDEEVSGGLMGTALEGHGLRQDVAMDLDAAGEWYKQGIGRWVRAGVMMGGGL